MPQILVIDDDPGLLDACAIGLAAFGHAVTTAGTAVDGIASARSDRPDVVVLDMGLPDADGRIALGGYAFAVFEWAAAVRVEEQ